MAKIQDILSLKQGRSYEVLGDHMPLSVAGRTANVRAFAETYAPEFYVDERLGPMRPDTLFYEVQSPETKLVFNYYLDWKDEVHPNPLAHALYRGFRSLVYGSPRDIEYVQVRVSFRTGQVTAFTFERDPSGNPDTPSPKHDVLTGSRKSDEEFFNIAVNGKSHGVMPVKIKKNRLRLLVATWNHTYDFYTGDGVRMDDTPLQPLTDELYKKHFIARRSRPPKA